jgi:hypothetical protein
MLAIVHQGGFDRPVVICDWCEQRIESAADGNYEWQMATGRQMPLEPQAVFFTHKRCCHPFEMAHGGRNGTLWGAIGLEALPVFLARNLGLTWGEKPAASSAALMALMR